MNSSQKIRELERALSEEKDKISKCSHEWSEPFYNPETVSESYGYKMVKMGSDVWGEPEGYHDVIKQRWTRECKKCGFQQHTHEQKAIIEKYVPNFKEK